MDLNFLGTSKPGKKTKRTKNGRIELDSNDEASTPEVHTRNTRARRKKTKGSNSKKNKKQRNSSKSDMTDDEKAPKTKYLNINSDYDSKVENKENAFGNIISNTKKRESKRQKKKSKIDNDCSDASHTNCDPINSTFDVENSTFEVEKSIFDISELPQASAKKPKNSVGKNSSKKKNNESSVTKSSSNKHKINKDKSLKFLMSSDSISTTDISSEAKKSTPKINKDKSLTFLISSDSISTTDISSETKKSTSKASEAWSAITQDTNSSDPEATKYLRSKVTRRKHWDTSNGCSILNSSGLVTNLYPKKTDSSGDFSEKKEAIGTNEKTKKEIGTTGKKIKIPDFASIHKKRNEKIENIQEMLERKSARANRLLSGLKPESTVPSHIPKIKKKLNFSPKKKLEKAVKMKEQLQRKSSPSKQKATLLPTKKRSLEKIMKVEGHLLKISKPPKPNENLKSSTKKSKTKILKKKSSLDKASKAEDSLVRMSKPSPSNSDLQASETKLKSKIPMLIKAPIIVPDISTKKSNKNYNLKSDKIAVANKVRTRQAPKQDLNSNRQFLKYVRTNRRFDLLMEMRKIKN